MKVQLQNTQTFSNVAHDFTFPNSSRVLYWDLVKKIGTTPTSKHKYEELFPTTDLPWQEIYLIPRTATLYSKTREFQYKHLNGYCRFTDVQFLRKVSRIPRASIYILRYLQMLVHTYKRILMNFFCYVHQHGRHGLCPI